MITVFTPSYNRAYTLPRLFGSLQRKTCSDFEWLIVDDGSTDGTAKLCEEFAKEARFPLRYVRQENFGKHVAINRGAIEANGEWFFIVDSDDYLPPDSIEINKGYLSQISGDARFAGVSGVRARADGSWIIGQGLSLKDVDSQVLERFSREYIDATSQDYRVKFRMPGDRAEVVRTSLVRKYPFPWFEGERFVSEYYFWQSISEEGLKFRWFNKPSYCGDYLADGLTTNVRAVFLKSPLGRSFIDNFTIGSHAPLSMKIRSAVNYMRYGRLGGKTIPMLLRQADNKPFALLGLPVAVVLPLKGDVE
ncbi:MULTISPECIES: glycosyltransferase family 2 protein [unclassified Collinsella]|uniref:glycosyltransferase family 2 protein n=1 Tax=unclassified Collinsella TaxID=2637548 RepID=UPI003F8FC357